MKPNLKTLDNIDPEFQNSRLSEADIKQISTLLLKRKSSKPKPTGAKPTFNLASK